MIEEVEMQDVEDVGVSKKNIGFNYDLIEGHRLIYNIGGYNLTNFDGAFYLCGGDETNITASPIQTIEILPLTKERLLNNLEQQSPLSIGHTFNLDDYEIYYVIKYAARVYIFDNIDDALQLLAILVQYKAQSLIKQSSARMMLEMTRLSDKKLKGEL